MTVVSNVETASARNDQSVSEEPIVRAVGGEIPRPVGALLATLVVLVSLGLFVWSLIVTWGGNPHDTLPLFSVFVAGTVVSLTAVYARRTFSYVIALIGAAAWLCVSIVPFLPAVEMILQAVTVTIMFYGVTVALEAVKYAKRPRF